jgi:leader peptidase (prepilin peptidase) / N-methyltransferase
MIYHMALIVFFIFILGLLIGSFLNCMAWRLHTGESALGRSHCPKCNKQIAWYDNIPVLSYLVLRGKCRNCHQHISIQYPLVEIACGVLFVLALLHNLSAIGGSAYGGQSLISNFSSTLYLLPYTYYLSLLRDLIIISSMVLVFIIDLRWYLIFDITVLPVAVVVLVINLFLGMSWQNLLVSGIIGAGIFLFQYIISKGKWIGGGDIRLGLFMGFALGWPNIIAAIMLAYIGGSIIGLMLIAFGKKKWGSEIPLGAFLAPATIITLLWGEVIVEWYMRMFGL